ncbi:MAG: response regulator [Thermodesulfovibrionales bacterium]
MVVICPKCKVKLKIPDERIAPVGSRFKCPKCSTVMIVKRRLPGPAPLSDKKILVAHEDTTIVERIKDILSQAGYEIITASNGIDAMVTATKERPFLSLLSVSLPKIYGFEVCKRLKERPELKDIKVILLASIYSSARYRRPPENLYGADGYLEEHEINTQLLERINVLKVTGGKVEESVRQAYETKEKLLEEPQPESRPSAPEIKAAAPSDMIEKARRLARTIISDIYLYSRAKFDEAIKNDNFFTVFDNEIKEGMKLYKSRIPEEVRATGDYFKEAIDNFIEKKKMELSNQ